MLLLNTASELSVSDIIFQTSNVNGVIIKTQIQKLDRQLQLSVLAMFKGVPVQSPILSV